MASAPSSGCRLKTPPGEAGHRRPSPSRVRPAGSHALGCYGKKSRPYRPPGVGSRRSAMKHAGTSVVSVSPRASLCPPLRSLAGSLFGRIGSLAGALGIAAAMGLVAVATTEAARAQATFSGLGDLPGGSFESAANAVSADGRVIVGSSISAFGLEAFRWEDGVMTGLGDLPGGVFSSAPRTAASADGRVIVGHGAASCPAVEAFRWENGMMNWPG